MFSERLVKPLQLFFSQTQTLELVIEIVNCDIAAACAIKYFVGADHVKIWFQGKLNFCCFGSAFGLNDQGKTLSELLL